MSEESKYSSQSSKIILSILSPPFLLTIIAIENLQKSLIDMGKASEEVFRGERLPILNSPRNRTNSTINQENT